MGCVLLLGVQYITHMGGSMASPYSSGAHLGEVPEGNYDNSHRGLQEAIHKHWGRKWLG